MRIATKRAVMTAAALALAVGVVAASAGPQRAEATQGYKVVGKWGKDGTGNGELFASSVAVDASGKVFVADGDNNRVQVFSATGKFLYKWGSIGEGNGQFHGAYDIAIAPDGTVWVPDYGGSRVQQFKADGTFLTSVGVDGFKEQPSGVAVDADGNLLVAVIGETEGGIRRFDKTPTGYENKGLIGRGDWRSEDSEVSLDGTVYQLADQSAGGDPHIRRYTADGKALGSFAPKGGGGARFGVDLDCNVWVLDAPDRQDVKYSPSGKRLGTAASPDLVALDTAAGLKGDLYVVQNSPKSIIHFVEDPKHPGTANVPKRISVHGGKATIRYGAGGFACPAQVDAVATLKGKGVSGRGTGKVAAGKVTPIAMSVHGPAGKTVKATFTIVLGTNGRKTTETKSVSVSFGK